MIQTRPEWMLAALLVFHDTIYFKLKQLEKTLCSGKYVCISVEADTGSSDISMFFKAYVRLLRGYFETLKMSLQNCPSFWFWKCHLCHHWNWAVISRTNHLGNSLHETETLAPALQWKGEGKSAGTLTAAGVIQELAGLPQASLSLARIQKLTFLFKFAIFFRHSFWTWPAVLRTEIWSHILYF